MPFKCLFRGGGNTPNILDTSDANAVVDDLKKGKTGYVNGIKITGKNNNLCIDWPLIDDVAIGNIAILVSDTCARTYAFLCTTDSGKYRIDWGDGTYDDVDSGSPKQHTYALGGGIPCSLGYTTYIITISPSVGNNLLTFSTVGYDLDDEYQYWGMLKIVFNSNTLTSVYQALVGGDNWNLYLPQLASIKFIHADSLITGESMSGNTTLPVRELDLSGLTSLENGEGMFYDLLGVAHIDTSSLSSVKNGYRMFRGLSALSKVDATTMVSLESAKSMFWYCFSLVEADLSNLTALTDITECFFGCFSLKTVNLSGLTALTDTASCFFNCYLLDSINLTGSAFSGPQLDEIFTSLVAPNGTIIITGTPGAGACTPSIATAKGWTVIGAG